MADKENSLRLTRAAAKKRAAAEEVAAQPRPPAAKRKREPLAELPHLSNASDANQLRALQPEPRARRKKKRGAGRETRAGPAAGEEAGLDGRDPEMCPHYTLDIDQYVRSLEVETKKRPLADFIEKVQNDVTANMRSILVDWLVEVAEEYKLLVDTLYLTVSYIDRYLSSNALNRRKLQLLGVSAMLIASKYEEISPPHVKDFCYITDNTYTMQEVVKMETNILKFLNFEMGNPTVKTFLRRFIRFSHDDGNYPHLKVEFLGNYLAELSLLDYGCVRFLPSLVAASAIFVARFTIDPNVNPWTTGLQRNTGYGLSELKDCIHSIHDLQLNRKGSSLTAIREKYNQHRFKCVSSLFPPSEIPSSYLEDKIE